MKAVKAIITILNHDAQFLKHSELLVMTPPKTAIGTFLSNFRLNRETHYCE